ncbi:Lipophorin receptor protein, partial [Operophtera brumata]
SRTCTASEFRCKSGRCIPASWRCDSEKDCTDGSDEDPSICSMYNTFMSVLFHVKDLLRVTFDDTFKVSHAAGERSCPEHKFVCATGHCIPASWRCDDATDCPDGSDEHQCGKSNALKGKA